MSKKKKKSPFPFILILIIAAVAGSNFAGPSKGWITKIVNNNSQGSDETQQGSAANTATEPAPSEVTQNSTNDQTEPTEATPIADPSKKVATAPALSEFEIMHKKFVDEYLSKHPKPIIGKRYKIPTLTNAIRDGELASMDDFKVYLIKVKPYNAKTNLHYSVLTKKAVAYFFPEKAANSYADKKLEEYLNAQNKIQVVEEPTVASKNPKKSTGKTTVSTSSFSKFDTTVTESSSRLAHAALEVKNYLSNQSRISKKRDGIEYADIGKCHAKQHGRASVFYMYVPTSFMKTSSEYRFQVIDGVRRFWALRCMSNAVAGGSNSYLCVVYKDKIVGGSKLKDAEDTWAK